MEQVRFLASEDIDVEGVPLETGKGSPSAPLVRARWVRFGGGILAVAACMALVRHSSAGLHWAAVDSATRLSAVEDLRSAIIKGEPANKYIKRAINRYDEDRSRSFDLEEFQDLVADNHLDLTEDEVKDLFGTMDSDASGEVSSGEFMVGLQGGLSDVRLAVVKKAFARADKTGDGVFDEEDLENVYDVKKDPRYQNGSMNKEQIYADFMKNFEPDEAKRDGKVTLEEFIDYYTGVSAGVHNDAHFDLMMRQSWKI